MSSSGLSLQERIQRTRKHRRGPSPVTTSTSSPEEERTRTSSPEVQVQKERLTRGGSYRAATATLSTASSSALSTKNEPEKRSSSPRKVESLAQRRERVLRRKAAQQNPDERRGHDDVAEKSPVTKEKAETRNSVEADLRKTPETTSKIQARWPPSPALKAFLDDHEEQASSRSLKATSSGKRESQSKTRHEKEKSPSSSANKPAELRAPFFRTSPVASTTSPAVKKAPWIRPGATEKALLETTESPVASPTSPTVKPSWVRPVANDEAPAAATEPAWLSTSPVASTISPAVNQQKPSWVRPTTNKEAESPAETREPAWLSKSPASSTTSSGAKQPSWVRSVASKAAKSAAMESVASPKTSPWAGPAGKEQTSESPAPNAADASTSKKASWAQPSSRGRAPSSNPTPTEAISSTPNAAENPKKSSWTRPIARALSPAPTSIDTTSPASNATDASIRKQTSWARPTARARSPDRTTPTTTSKVPNTEDVILPKNAFWSRPSARARSPVPRTATAASEVPDTEDDTSPKGAFWSGPTPRAPSPAASTASTTPQTMNTEDAGSPRNSPEARPIARAPPPPTAAVTAVSSGKANFLAEENSVDGEDADDEDSEFERTREKFIIAEASDDEDSDFEQMRKAGVNIDHSVELENMIDQGDWSAVVAAASRLSNLEVQTDDDSDSSESKSDSLPGGRRGWLGISSLLDKKPAIANQSKQEVSTDVDAIDAPDEISLQKSLSSRPVVTQHMPLPPPNAANQQAPPLARKAESEQPPPPPSSTPNTLNQQRARWPQPSGTGRPPSPVNNTVSTAGDQKTPWRSRVTTVDTVRAMSPDSSLGEDEVKDYTRGDNATNEPPDLSIDDKSTPNTKGKTISGMVSTPANGSNQKQSVMSRSYRKPPSLNVGSKHVPPWVRSTARQPEKHAPAKKESTWSRSKVPSQLDSSDKQVVESPPWIRSGNKQAPQSPPSSPSRKILDEVKTRRKPTKLQVTTQNLAELESSDDEANLVYSYGGAVIETPKSASVASLSNMFSSGGSVRKERSRSTPPTTLRPLQKSWPDQPASPAWNEHEEASPQPQSKHFASEQYSSSVDSSRGRSSQLPGSKRDSGQPSAIRSAQPSWKKPGTSTGPSSPMIAPQLSWAKRDTSLQGNSVSVQNSQSLGKKRNNYPGQGNQVTSPPPSWVHRDMSRNELSSIRPLQPTLTKSAPSYDHSSAALSWINRSTSQEKLSPIISPQVYATTPARSEARSSSFRSAPPSWVNRDTPQGEISPINSPPTMTAPSRGRSPPPPLVEQGISEGECSPIRAPSLVSARTDPSNTGTQSFEHEKSTSASPLSRTSGSYPSEDSWRVQQRTAENEFQWEEPVAQVEDVIVSGSFTREDTSGESHLSREQSSSLSHHDLNISEDHTPPASEQTKSLSVPTKSLAQMAADSVYAIDYELMTAQAKQDGNIEDGEVSPVSSGIEKSIPQERELPEEVKAMMDMNRLNVSSLHYDDSRAYEADFFGAEGSPGVHDKSCSSWDSKEISALPQGSFVPRLSPSKKDIAHSSPRRTKRVLNFTEEGPPLLEESRKVSATISEKVSALDITVDNNEMSSRIEEKVSAMSITLDDSRTDESDVGPFAILGDPDWLGAAEGLAEELAPSILASAEGIEGWSLVRAKEEPMLSPSFLNDLGTPIDFSIQMSPDSPRRIGPTEARISDSLPKEMRGKNALRFGDPMSFGAAGGDYATESAPSVLDRGHAIEEWKGGHVAHPRHSPCEKEAGAPPESAKGAKHVLQYFSPENDTQDLMAEASRLENPEKWAERDPEVRMVPRMSRDTLDAQKESEEIDALKDWHFTHVPPHDAKKTDPQDPFFQQGDPFGASNISADALDSNAFYQFAEETAAKEDSFDFQLEKSAVFFSPYGNETPKKEETPTKHTGIVALPPRSRAASKAKLKPSRRDRVASMERYDHYYSQQERIHHAPGETFEI